MDIIPMIKFNQTYYGGCNSKKEKITFGRKLPLAPKTLDFDTFTKQFKNAYEDNSFEDVALKICSDEKNLIGEGGSKKVFRIEGVKDFLIALMKNEYKSGDLGPFESVPNVIPEHNFGQCIASNRSGLYIIPKVNGESHSLPNWLSRYKAKTEKDIPITGKEAQLVAQQIKKIANFPLRSYEDFALQLDCLTRNKIRVDALNPNNILVDGENKAFNLIDIDDDQKIFGEIPKPLNGSADMIALLLDSLMHVAYKDALTTKDSYNLGRAAKCIIEKCRVAAEKSIEDAPETNTRLHFELVMNYLKSRNTGKTILEDYDQFFAMYSDLMQRPID